MLTRQFIVAVSPISAGTRPSLCGYGRLPGIAVYFMFVASRGLCPPLCRSVFLSHEKGLLCIFKILTLRKYFPKRPQLFENS